MYLVFLGAPGAGKGTHAGFVSQAIQAPIVSTGNLLREAIRQGSPLGQEVKAIMDRGDLVPDAVSIALMREKLTSKDCENGAIIDGFPRTLAQAQALDEFCPVEAVLSLEVSDEVLMERMAGRRTCPKCQKSYHILSNPPKTEGICDVCGTALGVRDDDKPEVVRNRFRVYHELTEPIKAYYQAQGKLRAVRGHEDIARTRQRVFEVLGLEPKL